MNQIVSAARLNRSTVLLPADKSVAHRSALFAAISEGTSVIKNFPDAADPQSTLSCLRQLGIPINEKEPGVIEISGRGRNGLSYAPAPIDCGNSGTTMRLLSGILAGRGIDSHLVGDESLSSRPMARIADPLRCMGANIFLHNGTPPIRIRSNVPLHGMEYLLPIPSAQVKSCILLAGLFAKGTTTVIEPVASRDHTERMLNLPVKRIDGLRHISSHGNIPLPPLSITLPRDFSAAAFFLVAGTISEGGPLSLPGVGLNPTRTALLHTLRKMGADILISNERVSGGEPVGDLTVHPAPIEAISLGGKIIANLIDEIPVLSVAACFAKGQTVITGASELRVKECDRIRATVTGLQRLGADIEELEDGLIINGGTPLKGASVDSFKDHRIAMAMGIAGLQAIGQTTINNADVAEVSFPRFWELLRRISSQT